MVADNGHGLLHVTLIFLSFRIQGTKMCLKLEIRSSFVVEIESFLNCSVFLMAYSLIIELSPYCLCFIECKLSRYESSILYLYNQERKMLVLPPDYEN